MSIDFEPLKKWYGEQKWTDYMDEQNENVDLLNEKLEMLETSEATREEAEDARIEAEDARIEAEDARAEAEEGREEAEDARVKAEEERETAYLAAESARDGQYTTAEGTRNSQYTTAEGARGSQYTTAEGARDTAYGLAEGARDGLYATAESGRTTTFNGAEGTRNAAELVRVANENARLVFENYNATKDYVIGNKVAYSGSSYRALKASKGVTPGTDSTTWLLFAKKGENGDISNLTATHIANALGFTPIEYTEGDNVTIDEDGEISATDTITTINGQTGAISKADIVALGIPGQDTVYDDSALQAKIDDYSSYATSIDDNGVYKIIEYKRDDGTLYMKSTLSNPDTDLNYGTMTWQFYNAAGTSVVETKTWTITYDDSGGIVSKVVS